MKANKAMRLSGVLVFGAVLLVLAGCPTAAGAPPGSEFVISFKANGTPVTMTAGASGTAPAADGVTTVTFEGVPCYINVVQEGALIWATTSALASPEPVPQIPFIGFSANEVTTVGSYVLDGNPCLLAYSDGNATSISTEGTLEITEFGDVGGSIRGTFSATLSDPQQPKLPPVYITEGSLVVKRYPDLDLVYEE